MERSAPYALIAAFVLLAVAIGAGLLIWLTDYDPGRRTATYAVVFDDVSGLSLASEVRYNGLPVGEVATMALDPAGTGLIRVEIEVLEEVPLRQGSVARLSTQGVTGVAVVALEGGDPRAGPLPEGPTGVPMLASGRGAVETLADEAPALLEEARALIGDLRAFVTAENAARVTRILTDLEQGAAGLGEIGALAEEFGGIGRDLAPALRGLPEALARVEGAAGEIEGLATTARELLDARGPGLATATEAAIAETAAAAETARLRLEELAAPLASVEAAVNGATDAARDLRAVARSAAARLDEAGPLMADVNALVADLRVSVPPLVARTEAAVASVEPVLRERLPSLADRTDAALAAVTGAAETARLRLEDAEPVLEAAAAAADGLTGLAGNADALANAARGTLDALGPILSDAATTSAALRSDLPSTLQDVQAAAATVRDVASDRLPPLVDRADRALEAAADAGVRLAEAGGAARDRLDETAPLFDALTEAARAVDTASGEVAVVAGSIAPAAEEIAAAGTRLAGAAETFAVEAGPLAQEARTLLSEAREAVITARGVLGDLGRAAPGLDRTLRETAAAADAVARLARSLARDPSILIRGR